MPKPTHLRVAGEGESYAAAYAGVDEGGYDPDGFYVVSVNQHDHRTQTRVTLKPETKNAIDALIASGELSGTPIKTYGAFMRDAAVHNLHRLARVLRSGAVAELAERERHAALIDQLAAEAEGQAKLADDMEARLNAATKASDVYLTERLVEMGETLLESMREPYVAGLEETLRDARRWLKAHAGSKIE